jgi:lysophospholipase L1-like esterase
MEKNICIFGDSITHGFFDEAMGGWTNWIKIFLEKEFDVAVYNLGISGEVIDDVLERFENESRAREANVLMFAIGINDSQYIKSKNNPRTSLEKFESNLKNLIAKSREFTNEIYFIGLTDIDETKTMPIPWRAGVFYDKENIFLYNQALKSVCDKEKVFYLDMSGVLDIVDDLTDGLHPNSKGHEKIFLRIKKYLMENVIRKK